MTSIPTTGLMNWPMAAGFGGMMGLPPLNSHINPWASALLGSNAHINGPWNNNTTNVSAGGGGGINAPSFNASLLGSGPILGPAVAQILANHGPGGSPLVGPSKSEANNRRPSYKR